MATTKRLLPAILLALAACKMSTDDLRPKTDAECAATDEKACGYKCVARDDPATGCGNPGCGACPDTPAYSYAACTPAPDSQCGWACEPGWADCNLFYDDGCETFVGGADPVNCGACGRSCDPFAACSSGMCTPLSRSADGEPRGILHDGKAPGRLYWVDDGSLDGSFGEVMTWDGSLTSAPYKVAKNLDARPGSPALFRLALVDSGATPKLYVTGALSTAPPSWDVAVFDVDPSGMLPVVTVYQGQEMFAGEGFQGLAALPGSVFFAREGFTGGPCYVDLTTMPSTYGCVTSGASIVRGLMAFGPAVFFGYPDDNGTLSYVDPTSPTTGYTEQGRIHPIGSWPSRIAVYRPTDVSLDPQWFWADERDGSVWRAEPNKLPALVDAGTGIPTLMDIAGDAWGVVWTDYRAGKVRAWRGKDGAVFDLSAGGGPLGVALSPGRVFWTDSPTRSINTVPK